MYSKKIIIFLCILVFICVPFKVYSYPNKHDIEIKKKEIILKKKELEKLKQKQKKLYLNIVEIEKRINTINENIDNKKIELLKLKSQKDNLESQIKKIKQEIKQRSLTINQILNLLWKIYLRKNFIYDAKDILTINLKYIWLKAIYKQYNEELKSVHLKQQELIKKALELNLLEQRIRTGIENIESKKDELLKNKIVLFHNLQKVRAISEIKEKQLEQIIDTVEKIKYNLKILSTRDISKAKGYLLWPIKGGYRPIRQKKGIVIPGDKGTPVVASFWGKVVYVGKLRGFGDVVVLFHGKGYYTLYAYLSEGKVRIGQMVERGEPIGETGYCPLIRKYGLYFEIRKGKYTLNPGSWLKK